MLAGGSNVLFRGRLQSTEAWGRVKAGDGDGDGSAEDGEGWG